jgi:hypothetical protein
MYLQLQEELVRTASNFLNTCPFSSPLLTRALAQVQVFSYRSNDCTGANARLDLRTCYDIRDTNSVEVTGIFKDGL